MGPFPVPPSSLSSSTLHSSHSLSQSHQNQLDSPCFNLIAGAWAQTQRPSSYVCSLHTETCLEHPRMTSAPPYLLPHPQMLCLPWEAAQASGSPVDQYPPPLQVCPHPSPTPCLSCQPLGGDGSHLERGPEDPGVSACRIGRGGVGMGRGLE